jgi:hypothetical protein
MLKNKIIEECLLILKRDDVKKEMKELIAPVIEIIMNRIYPYLYISMFFVLISFLLHLGIFILLFRSKK